MRGTVGHSRPLTLPAHYHGLLVHSSQKEPRRWLNDALIRDCDHWTGLVSTYWNSSESSRCTLELQVGNVLGIASLVATLAVFSYVNNTFWDSTDGAMKWRN